MYEVIGKVGTTLGIMFGCVAIWVICMTAMFLWTGWVDRQPQWIKTMIACGVFLVMFLMIFAFIYGRL